MASVSIILRRPPYGTVDASEAIRHALGGVAEEIDVRLILVDGGVNAARRSQDVSGTPFLSLKDGIRDCIDMGVEVMVDKASMKEHYLELDDLVEGVKIVNSYEIAEAVKESDAVIIF